MLKKLFGKGTSAAATHEMSIEDLVVLERYDEAIERLEKRTKDSPHDLHSHLRLAEVYSQVGKGAKALDAFLYVADMYTDDGFYDKALAQLNKVSRLAPNDDGVRARIQRIQRLKALEHSRVLAIEGLVQAQQGQDPLARTSPVEVERMWQGLASTSIVERLSGDQLKRLFGGCELWAAESRTEIAAAGSREEFLLILITGAAEATHVGTDGQHFQLRTFAPGDIFGDRALLEHKPWPATYRTLERSKFVRVGVEGLERAMMGNPDPRALLDALRAQRSDSLVAAAVEKLEAATRA
ncbi:MAG: cyclic nucleotide-binding domain-containing protein [Thermoanaerobaculia bacterium]